MPAAPATRTTRRRARSRSNGSSRASRERAHSLLEVRERDRRPQRIAADDRARAGYRGPHRGRRDHPAGVVGGADDAVDPLTEADQMRDARSARAEEDDDLLVLGEFRRTDDDAAQAAELSARNAELQRRSEIAFEISRDVDRDEGLDRAPIVGPASVDGDDASARDRDRIVRQLAEIGRNESGCVRGRRDDDKREKNDRLCHVWLLPKRSESAKTAASPEASRERRVAALSP